MAEIIYKIDNISFSYPNRPLVLDGVSFNIESGESTAILGANACGKSTLLHLMDGLYFPRTGNISFCDKYLTEENVEIPPFSSEFRQKVGFLFQNSDAQLFCQSVEEEIAFGPLQLKLSIEEVKSRVEDVIKWLELEHLRDRSPQTLSGGEKKKVALASLLTLAPKVLLLDEPTAGLDPRTQHWLVDLLQSLYQNGITLIIASHDLTFVSEIANRAMVLSEEHKLVADAPVMNILNDLDLLLSVNLIHAHKHKHGTTEHEHPHLHETLHEHKH